MTAFSYNIEITKIEQALDKFAFLARDTTLFFCFVLTFNSNSSFIISISSLLVVQMGIYSLVCRRTFQKKDLDLKRARSTLNNVYYTLK